MGWKWDTQTTFTALLIAGLGTCGGYIFKQIAPGYKSWKKFLKKLHRVEDLDLMETRLEILENTFVAWYDILEDPIYKTSPSGEVTYVNAAWLEMTGITDSKNAFGFGYMAAIPDEDFAKIERLHDLHQAHPSSFRGNVRFKNVQTGEIITTRCKAALVYDFKDNLIETIGRIYILKIIKN